MAKIFYLINKHSCGHEWMVQFARGVSKSEAASQKEWNENKLCPKCEEKQGVEMGIGA